MKIPPNAEMLPFCQTMWYNRDIPNQSLTKGGILMPKGKPNKRYTPEFKIKVVETIRIKLKLDGMSPVEYRLSTAA